MDFHWIDDIGSMLIAILVEGKIVAANSRFCHALQYSTTETCGMDLRKLLEDPNGDFNDFIAGSPTIESIVPTSNMRLIDKTGKKWPVKGTVVRTGGQDKAMLLLFCRIETETDCCNGELKSGFRDFQIKTLGRMTETLVHDFRNIFGIITGYSEMVRERLPEDKEIKNDLGEVLAACTRGKKLLNNINAFCKTTQVGNVSLDAERSVGLMIEKLKSALPPKIAIKYNSIVKKTSISVDPVKLEQLLIGICLAVCDYAKSFFSPIDMTINISLNYKESDDFIQSETPEDTKYVQILIQCDALQPDRNSVERFNRLNEKLYRNSNEIHQMLETCRSILIELNGQIHFNCCDDLPAISILFPLADKNVMGKPIYAGPPHGKGQYVLVVDDEIQVADLTGRRLEKMGYKVVKKTNSIEALEYFSDNFRVFSLLIIDQVMPELPGLEFAQEVKKINRDVPIIMMTGYSSGITEKKCMECGIKSLVMKPIDEKELATIVASALR